MKTANRRPKLHKPTKGRKNYLKQGLRAIKKAIRLAAGPTNREGQHWMTPKAVRASYLLGFTGNRHTPHQGSKECARRVRQMKEHKCINPEVWT